MGGVLKEDPKKPETQTLNPNIPKVPKASPAEKPLDGHMQEQLAALESQYKPLASRGQARNLGSSKTFREKSGLLSSD